MAQLVEAIEGMAEACRFFETPITGGNVSLYNETLGEAHLPHAGAGHRRPDEDRSAGGHRASATPGRRRDAGRRPRRVRRGPLRRHAVRQGGAEADVGPAAGARHGVREARPGGDPRDGCRARWSNRAHDLATAAWPWRWPNRSFGHGIGARIDLAVSACVRSFCCSTKGPRGSWSPPLSRNRWSPSPHSMACLPCASARRRRAACRSGTGVSC